MDINIFKKRRKNETLLQEYERLVKFGNETNFIDWDTPFLIEIRDELEAELHNGQLTESEKEKLTQLDNTFKKRAKISIYDTKKRISNNDKNSEELKAILQSINYKEFRDQNHWWFHLEDL